MKKSELNEKFLGMSWNSIATGLITFLIGDRIKDKIVRKKVMNDPKIKKKVKNLTDQSLQLQDEIEKLINDIEKI